MLHPHFVEAGISNVFTTLVERHGVVVSQIHHHIGVVGIATHTRHTAFHGVEATQIENGRWRQTRRIQRLHRIEFFAHKQTIGGDEVTGRIFTGNFFRQENSFLYIHISRLGYGIVGIVKEVGVLCGKLHFIVHFADSKNEGRAVHTLVEEQAGRTAQRKTLVNEFLTELVFAYIQLRGTCGRILIHGKQAGMLFTRLDFVGNRKGFGSSLFSGVCRCGRRGYYGCFIIALRHAGHAQQQCCR